MSIAIAAWRRMRGPSGHHNPQASSYHVRSIFFFLQSSAGVKGPSDLVPNPPNEIQIWQNIVLRKESVTPVLLNVIDPLGLKGMLCKERYCNSSADILLRETETSGCAEFAL